ncbi:MAG: IS5 family transposase, partial [Puniceicoccales bacterium]|nr:IS5 family transposase [Puniceicoccales bacterium]
DFAKQTIQDADGKLIPPQQFFFITLDNGVKFALRASGTELNIKFYLFAEVKVDDGFQLEETKETTFSQSLCEVESERGVCQDVAKIIQGGDGDSNDRRNPFKSAQDGGKFEEGGLSPWHIGRTKGGFGSKLHAVCDGLGRPVRLLLTAGNVNDIVGAGELLKDLPDADYLLADKGYDANWFQEELRRRRVEPVYLSEAAAKSTTLRHKSLKRRHKIENMFSRLKDWRRIATRYARCAHTFFSAICIAYSFLFYLRILSLGLYLYRLDC